MSSPFNRATAMAGLIQALLQHPGMTPDMVYQKLGPYRSRGKGGKGRRYSAANHVNKPGKYMPHQGTQECQRRRARGW